jgi:glucokinase
VASTPLYLGVDIGGTKVAAGLVTAAGEIVYKTRVPMVSTKDAETGYAAVKQAIETVLAQNKGEIGGIGITSPGPLDPRTGVVINPPNLKCWVNFPLADHVRRLFGYKTLVDNDANAAGLAEAVWGNGVGYDNVFYATIGTGVGTGIINNKKIYWGRTGAAAEGGHNTIDYHGPVCGCGKRGCVEVLTSGTAIGARARAAIEADAERGEKILSLAGGKAAVVRAEHVAAAYREGDALATEILKENAFYLTVWFGNIIDLLEPDVIVVGGGVGQLTSEFFSYIREHLSTWTVNTRYAEIPLVVARYGSDSGVAGAAALCMQ